MAMGVVEYSDTADVVGEYASVLFHGWSDGGNLWRGCLDLSSMG